MPLPKAGDLLCTSRNPAAALQDLAVWGPLVVHWVMVRDNHVIHAVERGLIKTKFDDRTWPMQGKRLSSSPECYVVSSFGRVAVDRAEAAYDRKLNGEEDWDYDFLHNNCEHFARLMTEGKRRSTKEAALMELQLNMADAKPLKGLVNGIKQLNDAAGYGFSSEVSHSTGSASVQQGRFHASAHGPSAGYGAHLNDGAGGMARASAGQMSAGVDGIVSVHAGLNANTGLPLKPVSWDSGLKRAAMASG
eukprot:CAMPEP_0172905410 /NCGR_PEP_ID=MMETSP1075-20121228/174617_1 /TAXON_ID=2916 /ORGANISM="Ceratium fusus, Strain PA161109" /LENGTH=247 /DNA_ID=CAMNT_0013762635 /DNA_START=73 /DNA_END=817 /DNA_ORIENTATION=-